MSKDKLPSLMTEQDAGELQHFLDELAQKEAFKLEFDNRPLTEEVVKEQLDEQINRLADTVESVLPLQTLCEILGIPVPDRHRSKTTGDSFHD